MNSTIDIRVTDKRSRRIYDELAFAISRTDRKILTEWGSRSAVRFVKLGGRRINTLSATVKSLGNSSKTELFGLLQSIRENRLRSHVGDRTAAAIDGSISFTKSGAQVIGTIGSALIDDPRSNAPKVVAAFIGFYAGSGGVGGNGGIPDMDLLAGIGAHRSIFTHSIIAGVVADGLLLATTDLATQVYDKLPIDHDPLWDSFVAKASSLTDALGVGASVGIAYHLLVDAAIQPAPYHDLPFAMPIEGHQSILAANGIAEGADGVNRLCQRRPVEISQGGLPEKSTGRKVVDAVSSTATRATSYAKDFWRGFLTSDN